jgi:hypothetical protein
MGSMQLVSVGLIGEYIGRLYVEAKRRPIFIVRRTIGFDVTQKNGIHSEFNNS